MGEKEKIVSPHMIKNIVCWKKIQSSEQKNNSPEEKNKTHFQEEIFVEN